MLRDLPRKYQQRNTVTKSIRNACEGVGDGRSGCDYCDTDLSARPRVPRRAERRRLLVGIDDYLYTAILQGMKYRKYCRSRITKDVSDPKVLQAFNKDFCSVHFFHFQFSVKETIQAQDTLISKQPKTVHLSPKSFL
ncbi:hypothetical protein Mpsy_0436 [Methanolobus psychrophilus R15]|nr:hypothetical protein Mpsy_0436 [Methanolobus psychrophilus R15]